MNNLTLDSLNPAVRNVQYAVRGELAIKAEEYRVMLKEGRGANLPFDRVISSNIGNPQQKGLDQPPITFVRQVSHWYRLFYLIWGDGNERNGSDGMGYTELTRKQVAALMEYPELKKLVPGVFPEDVIERANELYEEIGSIGAYSHSQGVPLIRKSVANFIQGNYPFPPSLLCCCAP